MPDQNEIEFEGKDLNAAAVYAGMVFLRGYAESHEGKAQFRELVDRKGDKVNRLRSLVKEAAGPDARAMLLPDCEFPTAVIEGIYPGEAVSVMAGIKAARWAVWGDPDLFIGLLESGAPGAPVMKAALRFIRDTAN